MDILGVSLDQLMMQLLRWIHFIFGVIWIGHLYFLNLVNGPFEKGLDASLKKPVVPALRPRALFWFRWGAMFTFVSGVVYLAYELHLAPDAFAHFFGHYPVSLSGKVLSFQPAFKNWWITLGAFFGTVMWFNVWFVIWPRQKRILAGIATGNKPADFDQLVSVATLASRVNVFLSFPMLFAMGARSHFPTLDIQTTFIWMGIVTAVGFLIAYVFIFKMAPAVGKEFLAMMPAAPAAPAAPTSPK